MTNTYIHLCQNDIRCGDNPNKTIFYLIRTTQNDIKRYDDESKMNIEMLKNIQFGIMNNNPINCLYDIIDEVNSLYKV